MILIFNSRDFFFVLAQINNTSEKTPWDDEGKEDEKLKALAKKFEEKYVSFAAW